MWKLKLQKFGYLMQRANSLEKTLMLGRGRRRRGWQRMKWLDGITDATDMNLGKLQEMVRDREVWHAAVHGVTRSQTGLCDWTNGQGSSTSRAEVRVGCRGILLRAGQGAVAGAPTAWGAQPGREKTLPHWSLWTRCVFYWLYPCQPPETREEWGGRGRRDGIPPWAELLKVLWCSDVLWTCSRITPALVPSSECQGGLSPLRSHSSTRSMPDLTVQQPQARLGGSSPLPGCSPWSPATQLPAAPWLFSGIPRCCSRAGSLWEKKWHKDRKDMIDAHRAQDAGGSVVVCF